MKIPSNVLRSGLLLAVAGIGLHAGAAQFEDATKAAGLQDSSAYCFAAAWGDYNNDGFPDLFIAAGGAGTRTNFLYLNDRDGSFTQAGPEVGPIVTDKRESHGCGWADFNNDGYRDLLVINGAWGTGKNDLYWNHGDGTFGRGNAGNLTSLSLARSWPAFADFDSDGYLDVYQAEGSPSVNRLYRGTGHGTFTAVEFGSPVAVANDAVWGDFDNDGDPDLFTCNFSSRSTLWRNDGHGVFTEMTNGLPANSDTIHAAWADFDRDGDLDIALSSFGGTQIYRNDGEAGFVRAVTLNGALGCPTWADYDNDGLPDLLAATGQTSPTKAVIHHNNGDGTFTRVEDAMSGNVQNWMGPAWADYDNDGGMDVVLLHTSGKNRLYRNLKNANHWIKFQLAGTASNRDAIGAKVRVQATINGQSAWQLQEINGGYQVQNDIRPHFGLGDATNVDLARIEWPSGNVTEMANVAADQILSVTEAAGIVPVRPSASLNGTVTLTSSSTAVSRQWQFEGVDIVGRTTAKLVLKNLTAEQAGRYSVVVNTGTEVVTNHVYLLVDPAFSKITEGPAVTDQGCSWGGSWGDYDGDGYPDLFVARHNTGRSTLYRNQRDGTFTGIKDAPFTTVDAWITGTWVDLDNDGRPDLVAARDKKSAIVYFNDGDGNFSPLSLAGGSPNNLAVIDFDRDGLLDIFFGGNAYWPSPSVPLLYRNNGDRTFTRMTTKETGPLLTFGFGGTATSADYDDDGWVDVFCSNYGGSPRLFRNDGTGRFGWNTNVVFNPNSVVAGAWGDYDNDGDLDLCAASTAGGNTLVYRNLGAGQWERADIGLTLRGSYFSASWADYDNDGFLDLLLTCSPNGKSALFHNTGDGTFSRLEVGSIVADNTSNGIPGTWVGLWFDYDNDGFLDLYEINNDWNGAATTVNSLYHNNGNRNAWLRIKLIGTASNRDAVGAKVRVQASYAGKSRWQRRDIASGDGYNGNQLYAQFGLGNARSVSTVRIEWPSGTVQELSNVATNQILTIWEPPVVRAATATDGTCLLNIRAEPNRPWQIQASSDLVAWQTLATLSSATVEFEYGDTAADRMDCRFYRVISP